MFFYNLRGSVCEAKTLPARNIFLIRESRLAKAGPCVFFEFFLNIKGN